jgi:MoaA/NifB/PqqE/SkfB family radical SAM enzyme
MDFYKILRAVQNIKSHRVKFFGLWVFNILNKRYLNVQFDPVLACNFKCKMCYFTDPEAIKKLKGIFKKEELEIIAKQVFQNTLKLQIGCGAEPTLFKYNLEIIQLAKKYNIPYISMVTNGNLLTKETINSYASNGLNEFILSMHGVKKETYEDFMDKGNYAKFHEILQLINQEKKVNKQLQLRINYTFNKDNILELNDFFDFFGNYTIDTLQLRPIDKIGNTLYNNFDLTSVEFEYKNIVNKFASEAKDRKINFIAPSSIKRVVNNENPVESNNNNSYLMPFVNCYISPEFFWKPDFNWRKSTFKQWKKEHNWNSKIFKNIFIGKKNISKINRNLLNYNVDFN